jgi:hypothetical protein
MAPVIFVAKMGVHRSRTAKNIKKDLMIIPGTYYLSVRE